MGEGSGSRCVFCETTTGKRSGEHLLRDWFNGKIPSSTEITRRRTSGGATVETFMPVSPFDMPVNDVCKRCNESWLNGLETQVGPTLVELANRRRVTIPRELVPTLAAWCVKTALVRTCVDRSQGWLAPAPLFRHLYENRAEPAIPPGCRVQVGFTSGLLREAGQNTIVRLTGRGNRREEAVAEHEQLHLVSFGLGWFFFQVVLADGEAAATYGTEILRDLRDRSGARLRLLWPFHQPHGDLTIDGELSYWEAAWAASELRVRSGHSLGPEDFGGNPAPPLTSDGQLDMWRTARPRRPR